MAKASLSYNKVNLTFTPHG